MVEVTYEIVEHDGGTQRPPAAPIVHKHRSRTGPDAPRAQYSGELKMLRLRVFALAILLAPAVPAYSQTLLPSSVETMRDVDPGVDDTGRIAEMSPEFRRKSVLYRTEQPAGTIIVNTADRYLYLIMGNGTALRYGIGVGRDGFQWGGIQKITLKREWPDWVPPPEMIQRQPYLPRWMAGGPGNPLGARAMNLGATVYRIHGTNAPQTIGQAVSSGCFRLVNDDVADLYDRVPLGTKVVVQHH
jgi:lipoprotein-anchoring transpeptidase ErfK/SrfK